MIEVSFLPVVVERGFEPHGVLFDVMDALALDAQELIDVEEQDPEELAAADVVLPPIAVVDEAGRPIVAVRLDREPGTRNFRIVLLTGPSA